MKPKKIQKTNITTEFFSSDGDCRLYRANVAPYYNPDNLDDNGPPHETVNGTCYSSWLYQNDITRFHSGIVSGSQFPTCNYYNDFNTEKIVDGYSCDYSDNAYYRSESSSENDNYVELQFSNYVQVTSVLVKPRLAPHDHYFHNMETRVGNFSGFEKFGMNTKIGSTMTFTDGDDLVKFEAFPTPIVGKYVMIRSLYGSDYIALEEMKVIGHNCTN